MRARRRSARCTCAPSGAALVVALTMLALSSPARAAPKKRVGVLVVASKAADEQALRRTLDAPGAVEGARVVGPSAVAQRVRQASAGVIAEAKAALGRAESAALNMARANALTAARAALVSLSRIGGRLVAPKLVARANLALASAQLLHPPDVAAARAAFRAALDADPKLTPDRQRYAPRVLRVLAAARKLARSARLPGAAALRTVRQRARLDALLLLRARRGSAGRVALTLSGGAAASVQLEVSRSELSSRVVALLRRRLGPPPPTVAATPSPATPDAAAATTPNAAASPTTHPAADTTSPRAQPLPPRPSSPWYRRWWVWALVGGAVATAAGVSIGVALSGGDDAPPGFDLRLRFPR